MPIEFRNLPSPLDQFSASLPEAALVGLIGLDRSGHRELLKWAARSPAARYIGPDDVLDFSPIRLLLLDHALSLHDSLVRSKAIWDLERLRRGGSSVLIASHDDDFLQALVDEVWWVDSFRLMMRGDPREVLDCYRRSCAERLREWIRTRQAPLPVALRRGDGRARVVRLETLDAHGEPSMVWSSGQSAAVRVTVQFEAAVEDPVVGIMIRTRLGFEVYGTNTELERVSLGPCAAGDVRCVTFAFHCALCPREYTITAASHDPDGVWHDWVEDAVAVTVTDARYTAGVANLRATVTATSIPG